MDPGRIAALRLVNQQIAAARARNAGELVSAMGAMQAQDYTGAIWAMGLRVQGMTEAAVEQAVAERHVVRTWPMRGTLHMVAAADVRWMLALLTPRVIAGTKLRCAQLELDEAVFSRCRKLFAKALAGKRQLRRDALLGVLEREKISTAGGRGYHILFRIAQEGVICFAAREGKQATFALLDEWVASTPGSERDREAALAELARRYFGSHGPATAQDFAWWAGLKVSDARAGLEAVSAQLARERMGGVDYWMPADSGAGGEAGGSAYLLPGFDEYLLGYKGREAVLDAKYAGKIVPGANGVFLPTVVLGGRVAGTWKRTVKTKGVLVEVTPFRALKREERLAVSSAGERYGRFLALPVEVKIASGK